MTEFEAALLECLGDCSEAVFAHVVLPNHYHLLVDCADIVTARCELGRLHGRSSRQWNREERCPGRKVFHGSAETHIKSDRHFHASINYLFHNPVKHGYARRWTDWPWSSARAYLDSIGREEAERRWFAYPIRNYGELWDPA